MGCWIVLNSAPSNKCGVDKLFQVMGSWCKSSSWWGLCSMHLLHTAVWPQLPPFLLSNEFIHYTCFYEEAIIHSMVCLVFALTFFFLVGLLIKELIRQK